MLDKYLVNNPKQHQHYMSPDSEYITLIMYATKLEINLCNFPAIWAVLSIILDTKSNDLQYVQCLQQVVDDFYDTCTKEAMMQLEQQAFKILDIMYDSISDDVHRVSDAVDRDLDKVDTNKIKMTYDNDSNTNTGGTKYDQNMKGAYKDTDTENNAQNNRYNDTVTQSKWSTETNEIDNPFLRDYDIMHRQMKDRQIDEYYKAQRQIYSAMMGDTPVKTVYNRQYIDNISAYDSEVQRISKSVHHKLDPGQISLLGAQWYTTVAAAAAMKTQDKSMTVQDTENALKAHMQNDNGQYKSEIYKRAESIIPQSDGTYNISDSSDADLHDYLGLANTNIIWYRTRGQKQRKKAAEAEFANRHLANICYASARLPAFLSTMPHIPSSPEGTRSHKALNRYCSLNIANDLGQNQDSSCWVCLSQSEAFLPLSLGCSDVAHEHDITLHIKGECMCTLKVLGTWSLYLRLRAATSNGKNTFYSIICLACSGCYSLCIATTSSVEEIVV